MVGSSNKGKSVIPETVMASVKKTAENMEEFTPYFDEFFALCSDPDVLAEMEPLDRAHALLLLAKSTTTIFTLKLRCNGINPENHPVKSEIERLRLYEEKLQRAMELSKAPLRPSVKVNTQAATRFIEHSLPDLTSEQRKSMREISKGEGTRMKYVDTSSHKRRKYQSNEKPDVKAAAQDFLEKAAKELLGDKTNAFKGPVVQIDDSDDDDIQTID